MKSGQQGTGVKQWHRLVKGVKRVERVVHKYADIQSAASADVSSLGRQGFGLLRQVVRYMLPTICIFRLHTLGCHASASHDSCQVNIQGLLPVCGFVTEERACIRHKKPQTQTIWCCHASIYYIDLIGVQRCPD